MDEWNELLQDDELFDMIIENMSLSKLQSSLIEEEINASSDMLEDGVPRTVLDTIESMNINLSIQLYYLTFYVWCFVP